MHIHVPSIQDIRLFLSPTASIFPLTSCRHNWLVFAVGTDESGPGLGPGGEREEMSGRAAFQYRSGHPPISVNIELPTSPKWTAYYYPRHLQIHHFSLKQGNSPMPANLTVKRHKGYLAGSLIFAYPLSGNGTPGIAFCPGEAGDPGSYTIAIHSTPCLDIGALCGQNARATKLSRIWNPSFHIIFALGNYSLHPNLVYFLQKNVEYGTHIYLSKIQNLEVGFEVT